MRELPRNIHGVEPALLHAELDKLDALPVVKGRHWPYRPCGSRGRTNTLFSGLTRYLRSLWVRVV